MEILKLSAVCIAIRIIGFVNSEESLAGNDSITINNYHQRHNCADVQFMLSNGIKRVRTTSEYISSQSLKLSFPEHLPIFDYQWLEVWCASNNKLLSTVVLDPERFYLKLDPFKKLVSYLRSGPILILDEKTLLVTNFHFEQVLQNVNFWVGTNSHDSSNEIGLIHMKQMEYKGEDIYVMLPTNLTMYDVEYFGVQSNNHNLTYTKVPRVRVRLPRHNENKRNKTTYIPKCCSRGWKKVGRNCVKISSTDRVDSIQVYNDTDVIENIILSYYTYSPNCREMYVLERDEAFLQLSGLLQIHDGESIDVISKDKFCIDYSESDDGIEEVVFTCFEDKTLVALADTFIQICIFCSVCCLLFTFFIFNCFKDTRKSRGVVIVGFSGSMLLRFLLFLLLKVFPDNLCNGMNPIYIYFYNSTFVWLFFLIFESYYRVSNYKHSYNPKRFLMYLLISTVTPAIISLLNTISNGVYILKDLDSNNCDIKNNNMLLTNLLFIVVLLIITLALVVVTSNKIKESKDDLRNFGNDKFAKKVLISSIFMMVIMYVSCASEFLDRVTAERNALAFILLDALQGVLVLVMFVLHNPAYDMLPWFDHSQPLI